jgi:beta-mannosidase
VDWYGAPKMGHYFMQQVLAPLHACVLCSTVHNAGMWFNQPVFLLDDADRLKGRAWRVTVRAYDGALREIKRTVFDGQGSIRAPLAVGRFELNTLQTDTAPLLIVSEVRVDGALADRTFFWVNYELAKGCLFALPRTTLRMEVRGSKVVLTNTGALPAVAAHVARPGHLDTFTASDNYFWLDAGESRTVRVNTPAGLAAAAWNA